MCCSVLSCVVVCITVCCSVRCSVLHCVALCCIVLHCVAVCCSVFCSVAVCVPGGGGGVLQCIALECCGVLQCVAVCCSRVLQCVAVCCSSLLLAFHKENLGPKSHYISEIPWEICNLQIATSLLTGWRRLIGSLILIGHFCKSDLYLVTLLWKMICNLGDPMSLRHPVL